MRSSIIILLGLALGLGSCGGDEVVSFQPLKPVCATYKDCWTIDGTPEGCCVDPQNAYKWICVDFQSDKLHCGSCETSCPGTCCKGLCADGVCQ